MMDYACNKDTILPVFVTRMEPKDKINSDIKKKTQHIHAPISIFSHQIIVI